MVLMKRNTDRLLSTNLSPGGIVPAGSDKFAKSAPNISHSYQLITMQHLLKLRTTAGNFVSGRNY